MKKYIAEFVKRGLTVCAGGPVVLAVVYGILGACGVIDALTPGEVCKGILTVTLMAFLAAGVTVVYQIEELALFPAVLIHGIVLYLDYLMIYLVNGWIAEGLQPLLVFTAIFVAGYAIVWAIIYCITRHSTQNINRRLKK